MLCASNINSFEARRPTTRVTISCLFLKLMPIFKKTIFEYKDGLIFELCGCFVLEMIFVGEFHSFKCETSKKVFLP